MEGRDILRVKNAGSKFGLNLVLDVQQDEYTTFFADQVGFMVLIHDQETPPMVEQLGFAVGPGTTTFAAFSKQKVICIEHLHYISRWNFYEKSSFPLSNHHGECKLFMKFQYSHGTNLEEN